MSERAPSRPVLRLSAAVDAGAVAAGLRAGLGPVLAGFLPGQRWYGEKARPLSTVTVVDVAVDPSGPPWFALALVEAGFADGSAPARYLLPLASGPSDHAAFGDAFSLPNAPARLLGWLTEGRRLAGRGGEFVWEAFSALEERAAAARTAEARPIGVEYSNSSVRFGDVLFLKVVRKPRAGPNPDEEIGRFLWERTGFRNLPAPLGAARYEAEDGTVYPFALAQAFVPSLADGWDSVLGLLTPDPRAGAAEVFREAASALGERTAQLHLALASDPGVPAFAPEPVTEADAAAWRGDAVSRLRAVAADLDAQASGLPASTRDTVASLAARLPELERRADGYGALVGALKCRVHGDFHLGQVLRTLDGDWVILDFEGEPARTIAERRAKTSPLKDVAGMLRSFSYARSAARRAAGDQSDGADDALAAWEAMTRAVFLGRYRATMAEAGSGLVRAGGEAFAAAVGAWEFDKAVYELGYELNNRPDWLPHALETLLASASAATA